MRPFFHVRGRVSVLELVVHGRGATGRTTRRRTGTGGGTARTTQAGRAFVSTAVGDVERSHGRAVDESQTHRGTTTAAGTTAAAAACTTDTTGGTVAPLATTVTAAARVGAGIATIAANTTDAAAAAIATIHGHLTHVHGRVDEDQPKGGAAGFANR